MFKNKSFNKILEIGAGSSPHYNYIKHEYDEYHIADTSEYAKDFHKDNNCFEVVGLYFDGVLHDPSKYKELADR